MGKCYECGKETDRYYWTDRDWAKKFGEEDRYWCQECFDKAASFYDWQNEQSYTEEIVCPWCGKEQSDSWEYADYDSECECDYCEKVFEYQRNIEVTYTSRKRECDYQGCGSDE